MKVLHLDSSALGTASASRELTAAVVRQLRADSPHVEVSYRDLDAQPLPHFTGATLAKSNPAEAELAKAVLDEFLAADVVVIGAPMYNFSLPSTLKAWIDRIAVAGVTFRYTANGPEGLAGGKRVIVASTRGGVYGDASPADFQEAYLRQVFAFIGISDVEILRAEGLNLSPESRKQGLDAAHARITRTEAHAA
ncbi:NAD(P)H-dependent oxidoreductase [uncultured Aquimonas sp.]|uniref:FMN-dependent NADH-azoreductase n=1 Tax=uncultured Aquimonas sp. TaxID=385483 RepID=UPI00086C60F4|nr:NAD(P)H-dependent oxidoreductase [uncultured Aquimonas sp.]ODU45523.1 MAG: FMN-dependent NADH-azoreductase [Xanthomonadaceae bacterium SCN 69-123]